jgi:hypothetical protein
MMDRVAAGETTAAMAPQLGNVAAYYIGDFNHAINKAQLPQYEHNIELGQHEAEAALRHLGKDAQAYTALMEAQQAYALVTVDYAFDPGTDVSDHKRSQMLHEGAFAGGRVAGILTSERAGAAYEDELDPSLHEKKRLTQNMLTSISDTVTLNTPMFSTAFANEMVAVNEALYAPQEAAHHENARVAAEEIERQGKLAIKDAYTTAASVMADHLDYGAELDAAVDRSVLGRHVENGFVGGKVT